MENIKVKNCLWGDKCKGEDCSNCTDYTPSDDENTYLEILMGLLREKNIPTRENKLTRRGLRDRYIEYDDVYTSDAYYVNFINDVLNEIRSGRLDYVYYEYQLAELLRFEPDMQVEIHDGVFYVSLPIGGFDWNK